MIFLPPWQVQSRLLCYLRATLNKVNSMKREDVLFLLGLFSLVMSLFLVPFLAYLFPSIWLVS